MNQHQLHELADQYLRPLISGSRLEPDSVRSKRRDSLVALADPCTIRFKTERADRYRLVLRRSQPFEKVGAGSISESKVVDAFVRVIQSVTGGLDSPYRSDILAAFPRRVVAKALCQNEREEVTLLAALDELAVWAGQQYEGKPIPAAIGFVPGDVLGIVPLGELCREDFSAVLSNGFDTLLTCDFGGQVLGHETLPPPPATSPFSPYRFGSVAEWAKDGRIALALNRTGEILAFQDSQLRFARRSGRWHFLTHAPVITQMGGPDDKELRGAVYQTCLDASFARTGACIGIVTGNHLKEWRNLAVSDADHLNGAASVKAKVLTAIIGPKKFQELDRRLRQELVAIDGATLIDSAGTVLAVGAILKIPGGSTGGGRLAAAKALSQLGVGIKVSQDGGISGFRAGTKEPKFTVMK